MPSSSTRKQVLQPIFLSLVVSCITGAGLLMEHRMFWLGGSTLLVAAVFFMCLIAVTYL